MDFDSIESRIGGVGGRAATSPRAGRLLFEFVRGSGARQILELGFAHGNSTCYLAGALDETGAGSILTIDRETARARDPDIHTLLQRTGLQRYVRPVFAHTSYNWELMRLIQGQRDGHTTMPLFDFVFIDGAHSWEVDGLAFFLADKLLRPGGWVLFDDVHWTMGASPTLRNTERVRALSEEERQTPQVMRVFSLLTMQHPDYTGFTVRGNWAWSYKRPRPGQSAALSGSAVQELYAAVSAHRLPLV